jgi:hypothetical protein
MLERRQRPFPPLERRQRASPSLEQRRGPPRRQVEPPVFQTIFKASVPPWPVLTKMNYTKWSSMMKVKLQAR